MKLTGSVLWFVLALCLPLMAQDTEPEEGMTVESFLESLHPMQGQVEIGDGLATLNVREDYRYLKPDEANAVLMAWGNPSRECLGLLYPAEQGLFGDGSWAVIITWQEDGYIKDDEAADLDYDDLLKDMKEGTAEGSKQRVEEGYSSIELVGWAEPPHYDGNAHKLYWAQELHFGGNDGNTLNYNIRALGRRGVLVLNAVADMSQLADIKAPMQDVVAMVDFNEGHRYADYDSKLDKVAAYGIGGLIAGKVAAKAGLFKVLIGFLLAAKKLVLVGVVAVGAFLKKIFSRGDSEPQA